MLSRLNQRGLVWPTLMTAAGLAVLVSLGTWQMRRLAWKEALIARLEARAKAPPVSVESVLGQFTASDTEDVADRTEFLRVSAKGRFLHGQEMHVWNPGKHGPAWSVVTPLLLTADGQLGRRRYREVLLVIRGTVPDAQKQASSRVGGNPDGEVAFVGRVRLGKTGTFSNPASVAKNEWYDLDSNAMRTAVAGALIEGSASGTVDEARASVLPFYIEAESATGGAMGPQPQLGALNLSNRHLEYALTWYGLAVTLLGVYLAFVWSRRRAQG